VRSILALSALAALAACVETESHMVHVDPINVDVTTGDYRPLTGIPHEHRPEPGTCRVWYHGVAADRQPRAGSCDVPVPKGAVLVRG